MSHRIETLATGSVMLPRSGVDRVVRIEVQRNESGSLCVNALVVPLEWTRGVPVQGEGYYRVRAGASHRPVVAELESTRAGVSRWYLTGETDPMDVLELEHWPERVEPPR